MRSSAWRHHTIILSLSSFLPFFLVAGDISYANVCGKTKYRANSTYQNNIQQVTAFLSNYPTFNTGSGFALFTAGKDPDKVYGLGLCRGDTPDNLTCYECLATCSVVAQTLCPYDKDAAIFYDTCTMRFSDQDFISSTNNEPVVALNNTNTVKPTGATSFDALVNRLINTTAEQAASNDVPMGKKMATGEVMFDAGDQGKTIYSLVQCTPDITPAECRDCLKQSHRHLDSQEAWGSGKEGGWGEV